MNDLLVAGLAAAIVLLLWKSRVNYLLLPTLPLDASVKPDVTVIIPARNEAHQIGRVVQSFIGLKVLVVDDASSDATAAVAQDAGSTVVAPPPLPVGHMGKPSACAAGARLASTKWLLFVDADTWFDPAFAASLVAYAEAARVPFVTAFLRQHCETLAEKALLPYAFALYFTGVSARSVNSAQAREALANGQCILFERSVYEASGGHAAVASSVIEDVALARHAKAQGIAVRVIRAEHMGHVRMYDSFAAIWRGFQKNSFRFLLINPWSGLQVVCASILLTSWLPALFLDARPYPRLLLLFAPLLSLLPWYRSWTVMLAPAGIYLFQLIALNGMLTTLTRRATTWKDRRV